MPFNLGPPIWVDDPNFDLRYHVRQTALPAPGGDQQLRRLMARVMTQRLDRDYPLWEYPIQRRRPPSTTGPCRPSRRAALIAARAAMSAARLPLREGGALKRALADPKAAARQAADASRGLATMARALWPAPGSSLTGPIGRQRRYTWARASLDDVKTIKREFGGTVNDVFRAAISSGFPR